MTSDLPLYVELNLILLVTSVMLCYFTWLTGLCAAPFAAKDKHNLPPITLYSGSRFPQWFDQVYTMAFIAFFAWQGGQNHYMSGGQELDPDTMQYDITMVLSNLLIYVPMLVRYATLPHWQKPKMGAGIITLTIICALFFIYMVSGIMTVSGLDKLITEKTGAPELQPILEVLRSGDLSTRINLIISAVIVAPICEECCFRGFLYNVLKRYSGVFAATIVTGLVFSTVHTALLQFIPLAVFGCVMCYVYERTRRLWVPILIHMIFNAISTAVVLLVDLPV